MGLKIRKDAPDDATIAQLIRQRANLLAALEMVLSDWQMEHADFIHGFGSEKAHNERESVAGARAAIQSAKGNAK